MADVLDFKKGIRRKMEQKAATATSTEAETRAPAFWSDEIDPDTVFKVLRDPKIQLAFVTMLLAMRQLSTDADLTISVDEDGVRFDSVNSVETGDPLNGFQANVSVTKQGYLFMFDEHGENAEPIQMTIAFGEMVETLVMYYDEEFADDDI